VTVILPFADKMESSNTGIDKRKWEKFLREISLGIWPGSWQAPPPSGRGNCPTREGFISHDVLGMSRKSPRTRRWTPLKATTRRCRGDESASERRGDDTAAQAPHRRWMDDQQPQINASQNQG
jgi:hypothetical protein